MHQTLLRINLPEGVVCHPAPFREKLATTALPSEFFHYGKEIECQDRKTELVDGKLVKTELGRITKHFDAPIPLNGRPPIRVIGGRRWLGVVADPNAEDLLMSHVGTIIQTAAGVAGKPCKVEIEQRQFGIRYTETPMRYMLREMAVKRRGAQAREKDIGQLVAERIFGGANGGFHGIDGTCAEFGFEPPVKELLEIKVFPTRAIGLHNRTSNGQSKEYVSLVDAEVWMNAHLAGIWQVGNLTARGYGRLIRTWGKRDE